MSSLLSKTGHTVNGTYTSKSPFLLVAGSSSVREIVPESPDLALFLSILAQFGASEICAKIEEASFLPISKRIETIVKGRPVFNFTENIRIKIDLNAKQAAKSANVKASYLPKNRVS